MKAVVVCESLRGMTAAVGGAIAEGLGLGTQALSTAQAVPEVVADADLMADGRAKAAASDPMTQPAAR